jgi:hypothetical protein
MTNDSKTGFLIYDPNDKDRPYSDKRVWANRIDECPSPFKSVPEAVDAINGLGPNEWRTYTVVDLTGKQVWPEVATDSTEVEALRKQVADLTAEVARLKADRRERIATAALAGYISCPEVSGSYEELAHCALEFADALIAKLDGKED